MYIVFLRFAHNKAAAPQWMEGHNAWLQRGFGDGVFVLAGSLKPGLGGCVLAHHTTLPDLQTRIDSDPFVIEGVVSAEIIEMAASRADERLAFLLN